MSCVDEANRVIEFKSKMSFGEGLRETHRWFVENWENIEKSADFFE